MLGRKLRFYYDTHKAQSRRSSRPCVFAPHGDPCEDWRELVAELDELLLDAPRDPYVWSQVVYTLVRGEDYHEALKRVEACPLEEWFCAMLRGHVLAESGHTLQAGLAFDEALAGMPDDVVCAWTDVGILMPLSAWRRYDGGSCRDRRRRLEEFWWLVDPSWLTAGNEREVEHYNRMTWATLHDDALEDNAPLECSVSGGVDDGCGHGRGHHRNVVLRGMEVLSWHARWMTVEGPVYHLVPSDHALLSPLEASPDDWSLDEELGILGLRPAMWEGQPADRSSFLSPRMRYDPLDAQVAFFERAPDSLHAVAAVDLPDSPRFARGAHGGAALILRAGAAEPQLVASTDLRRRRYVFRASAPLGRYVVAVEALGEGGVGRTRFGHGLPHDPAGALRLSDLLLYVPRGDEPPDSLEAVLPLMRGGNRWTRGATMGVFLEVYAPREPDAYSVAVELFPRRNLAGRLARALGMADRPVRVSWTEPGPGGTFALSFTVDLSDVSGGDYDVRVTVGRPGLTDAVVEKTVRVAEPEEGR